MNATVDTLIIGAGIAGLTVGHELSSRGRRVLVVEKAPTAGGTIRTVRRDGYLVEEGPNSLLDTHPEVAELLRRLNLADRRVFARPAARNRFILRNGVPVALPLTPARFLTTPLFGWKTKLGLLREPFVPAWDNRHEESVAAFVRRRLGEEFLDYAVNPFVAGVYAGDPEALGVRYAFPRLYQLEQRYGSLLRGQLRGARERRARAETSKQAARMYSFPEGLAELPRALARRLGPALRTATRVVGLRHNGSLWEVACLGPDHTPETLAAQTLVYAGRLTDLPTVDFAPARAAVRSVHAEIDYPPVAVLGLGFRARDVGHPLDGFGLLVPEAERRNILGVLFSSTLFPGRAPADHVLLTVFVGGARQPDLALLSLQDVLPLVQADLRDLLAVRGDPTLVHLRAWPAAIPQYTTSYGRVKTMVERLEQEHDGLFFAGNYRDGVSVPDTIKSSLSLTARIADRFPQAVPT